MKKKKKNVSKTSFGKTKFKQYFLRMRKTIHYNSKPPQISFSFSKILGSLHK